MSSNGLVPQCLVTALLSQADVDTVLFAETERMLALKPADRPTAATVAAALQPLSGAFH